MKNKKIINFTKIGLSLIFLFNPNVNIIDVFPDFIGYILLCSALTGLADMNDTVAEAHNIFKKLILIDAAKILAILWVFGISVTTERNSSLMLWSFAFGVLELIFVTSAFLKLFEGISGLGYLHQNNSVFVTGKFGKRSANDKARNLTVAFVVLKAVMSFLPELSDVTSTEYYENSGLTNLYQYIGVMRLLAFIPVLILGIVWIVRINIYFGKINRDSDFISALETIYNERVANKKGIFIKRNVASSFWVLLVAFVFSFDFRLENVNILPDFVSGILLAVFFVLVPKRTNIKNKLPILLCLVYTLVSAAAYVSEISFFNEYYYGAVDRSIEARNAFITMATLSTASTVLFAVVCIFALIFVKKIICTHTGSIAISDSYVQKQESMSIAIHKELNKYVYLCMGMLAFYALTDIMYAWLTRLTDQISLTGVSGVLLLIACTFNMSLINTVGAILFIAFSFKLYFEVNEAVNSRYILE